MRASRAAPRRVRGCGVRAHVIRGDAEQLPLPDSSVDLIVTSPPYFGLRSYTDACPTCSAYSTLREGRSCVTSTGTVPIPTATGVPSANSASSTPVRSAHLAATSGGTTSPCGTCGDTGRVHYEGQVGDEPSVNEYLGRLIDCTREWMRVLKPSGSLFVNLGDKYENSGGNSGHVGDVGKGQTSSTYRNSRSSAVPVKSLIGLPWQSVAERDPGLSASPTAG